MIYKNLTYEEYTKLEGVNNSSLNELKKSYFHYLAYRSGQVREETDALKIGKVIHEYLYNDNYLNEECSVFRGDKKTKEKQDLYRELERTGKIILRDDDLYMIESIKKSVESNQYLSSLLKSSERELTLDFEMCGVKCKARLDGYFSYKKGGIVYDKKSTDSASRWDFGKTIYDYGYHRQAAFYVEGARQNGLEVTDYWIIALQKNQPFVASIFKLEDRAIEKGREEIERLLEKTKEEILFENIDLPVYAYN